MAHQPMKAIPPDLQALLDGLKTAKDTAVAKIASLRDQVKVGMTQADVDSVKSQLAEVANGLNAASTDPVQ